MNTTDPRLVHTLALVAAQLVHAGLTQRDAVKQAADLVRLCDEHIRGAAVLQRDELLWPEEEEDHDIHCLHPDCNLPY